jgi:hypothetical protein
MTGSYRCTAAVTMPISSRAPGSRASPSVNRGGSQSWVFSAEEGFKLSWLFTQCSPGDSLDWVACRALSWPAWFAVRLHGLMPAPPEPGNSE